MCGLVGCTQYRPSIAATIVPTRIVDKGGYNQVDGYISIVLNNNTGSDYEFDLSNAAIQYISMQRVNTSSESDSPTSVRLREYQSVIVERYDSKTITVPVHLASRHPSDLQVVIVDWGINEARKRQSTVSGTNRDANRSDDRENAP